MSADLFARAEEWAAGDPDPATAAELRVLIADRDTQRLDQVMGSALEFGTAGIRGQVGAGSSRMNRAVVIRTTRGLAEFLVARAGGEPPDSPVIVGYDARPTSRGFAEDAAGVLAAAGIMVRFFPDFAPTPLVAFAAKDLSAVAAVVVTASHNPPADNGYKVYDSNAAQIIPPTDTAISAAIDAVGLANGVPRVERALSEKDDSVAAIDDAVVDRYWREVDSNRPVRPENTVEIVYTPLHGVGGRTLLDIFGRTSHDSVNPVPEQFEPDGTFPTVKFPNPEEKGALDLALALARSTDADLVIGNDPDADRLAAAVPHAGDWRLLTGNELGVVLGSYLLEHWDGGSTPITACSIVSSPMLARISADNGARHLTTLTGFKWIANAAIAVEAENGGVFLFGFEEALGYTVGRTVRDKDGISAALILADIAAIDAQQGRGVLDRLADLWRRYGIWVSTQQSIVRTGEDGQSDIVSAVGHIAANAPREVGGLAVTAMTDYREGAESREPWLGEQDLVEMELGEWGRILVRPSGTEPKLKIYVDLRGEADPAADIHEQRDRLFKRAEQIAESVARSLTDFMG